MTETEGRAGRALAAPLWAAVTAFMWYGFGAVPLQVAVAGQLRLSPAQTSSWIFVVWFGGAVSSLAFCLSLRKPVPITWSIPGLVYLGTLADQFTVAELAGANLIAGVLMLVMGAAGVGRRMMRWLPLPIVMGMFAGSILPYVTRLVRVTVEDAAIAGSATLGYLVARAIGNARVPPVGVAVLAGGVGIALTGGMVAEPVTWHLPTIAAPPMDFSLTAAIAVSLPLVVLSMGLGNVQGLGFLVAQGYTVPVNRVSTVVGINSVINALLGGHPATVGRLGTAILASRDAGPLETRYVGAAVAAVLTMVLACAAVPIASLLEILPPSFVFAVAGLAVLSAMQDALQASFGDALPFGALVAFAVAATPFSLFGVTSAFWGIVAGLASSLLAERRKLGAYRLGGSS